MRIRDEEEKDQPAVREIVSAEFDTGAEADLVDALRNEAKPLVSLVAEEDGIVVGHVMFSPVSILEHPETVVMGLAPLAVHYEYQGRGIGTELVRAGLERCRELGAVAVVALGHPGYYPRFGFSPAAALGIRSDYDVPDDTFMVLELDMGCLNGRAGTVTYHEAFRNV